MEWATVGVCTEGTVSALTWRPLSRVLRAKCARRLARNVGLLPAVPPPAFILPRGACRAADGPAGDVMGRAAPLCQSPHPCPRRSRSAGVWVGCWETVGCPLPSSSRAWQARRRGESEKDVYLSYPGVSKTYLLMVLYAATHSCGLHSDTPVNLSAKCNVVMDKRCKAPKHHHA